MIKYILDDYKTAIIDINPEAFAGDNTIVFPAEVDGYKITTINITKVSLNKLKTMFKSYNVVIEDGIEYMCEYMFSYSENLYSVSIPSSIKTIPVGCFGNSTLQKIEFSDDSNLGEIEEAAFISCTKLESISLPKSVKNIRHDAFRCSSLREFTFPYNEEGINIGGYAFSECPYLEKVTFPEMRVGLGKRTFFSCNRLETVEMSKIKTDTMPAGLFFDCTSLKNITLPETVTTIGESAFYNCCSLPSVGLGKTKTDFIIRSAFENCYKYADNVFPDSIRIIEGRAFRQCALNSLSLPLSSLKRVESYAFSCNPFDDGIDLLPFVDCEIIGDDVFAGCSVKSVRLLPFKGDNVSAKWLFEACTDLKSVQVEPGAELYEGIFSDCIKLKSLTLPDTLTSIPEFAFKKCEALQCVKFPSSIKDIGVSAFMGTDLKSVDLSKSKSISINSNAFVDADVDIYSVKLPVYDCTIWADAFNNSIVAKIAEEYPFVIIDGKNE